MDTQSLGSPNHRSHPDRAVVLGAAKEPSNGLKKAYWTCVGVLALSSSWVHAQTPTCAPPGSPYRE